jgi:transcriptional regulator with XRE-family HTH domain
MGEAGLYLKSIRGKISIRKVAEAIGCSNAYLSQLETGNRVKPNITILKKLSKFYGIPLLEIYKNCGLLDEVPEFEIKRNSECHCGSIKFEPCNMYIGDHKNIIAEQIKVKYCKLCGCFFKVVEEC